MQIVERQSEAFGAGDELSHEEGGLMDALAGTATRRYGFHESARALPHFDKSFAFQLPVGLHDRRRIHAQPRGELAHRRQGVARPQFTSGNSDP